MDKNLFFSSEHCNDENINIRSFRDETEVVEEKKGLNLTGAEEEAGAKSFMWLAAAGKPEKEIRAPVGQGWGLFSLPAHSPNVQLWFEVGTCFDNRLGSL